MVLSKIHLESFKIWWSGFLQQKIKEFQLWFGATAILKFLKADCICNSGKEKEWIKWYIFYNAQPKQLYIMMIALGCLKSSR